MAEVTEPSSQGRMWEVQGQGGIQTDLDLDTIGEDEVADVLPDLLSDYAAELKDWTKLASEHWKQGRMQRAEELITRGIQFFNGGSGRPADHMALLNLHAMLAHLHLALARTCPKVAFKFAKYDKVSPETKTKEFHYTEAAANLNHADRALQAAGELPENEPSSMIMGKIVLYLARGQPVEAQKLVERLLQRQPNNMLALLVQARLQFARRAHDAAFKTYQRLLTHHPNMKPDPRIGLGLCAWMLGDRERARAAWQRAVQRDPQSWVAILLLGLASLNTAREPSGSQEDKIRLETEGVAYVQKAFKLNNRSPAAALALASISGQGGQLQLASKLAERAIQYSDNKRHLILAHAERGRLGFMAGDVADAGPFIAAAKGEDGAGINMIAELTLGQIAIKNGNLREALNFIEQTAKRLNGRGPLEYTVLHASLLAYPHPGMKDDELARNRHTARNMLSEVHNLVMSASTDEDWAKLRGVGGDTDLFIDLARLWQDESLEKAIGAYQTAVSISTGDEDADGMEGKTTDLKAVRTAANLGALFQLQGNIETAERMYQEALSKVAKDEGKDAEVLKTVLAYNLGRTYEEEGDVVRASQWYRDVLRQHPEHMESKVRLAMLAAVAGRNFDAHTLLKECLKADESNITLRSVYTDFLISISSYKEALAFTSQTLKYDRSDPATFCALGLLHFTLGREAKSGSELAARPKEYLRSAEAYQRALDLDPKCANAAQGLAIALAEDTLLLKIGGAPAVGTPEEAKQRMRMAGQALGVFSKIADSITDGSVNINMGHSYFVRGDEEKAIQSYEAALNSWKGNKVPVLLYLSRAYYAYANRDSNFSAMSKALSYSQQAMHLQPSDRAILYNIAMILQKGAELILGLDPSKRTLEELHVAMSQAEQAVNMFRALADDRSGQLPYDADLADQRARYGDGLLRKAPEQLARQEAYVGEERARVEEGRKARAEEEARIQAAQAAHRAVIEAKAAKLAEDRRRAREQALAWQEELNARQAEEEARKAAVAEKKKARKEQGEIASDDEGEGGTREPREKKRKRKSTKQSRKIRSKSEISSDEDAGIRLEEQDDDAEASMTPERDGEGEGAEREDDEGARQRRAQKQLAKLKAKRKSSKKKQIEDPDEEDTTVGKKGKQFKSKAFIEDSDEEADEAEGAKSEGDADDAASPTKVHPESESENEEGMDVDEKEGPGAGGDGDGDDHKSGADASPRDDAMDQDEDEDED